MTTRLAVVLGTVVATVLLASCGAPSGDRRAEGADAGSPWPVAGPPAADRLLALEKQANEAYFSGDATFFEDLLGDRFVMLAPGGGRMDKAATIATIAGTACDVTDGWTLDEARLARIDADTYVLSYKGTFDGTCTSGDETARLPSPVRGATVWVRSGESWAAAFHGENPIFDPRSTDAPTDTAEGRTGVSTAKKDAAHGAESELQAADPITDAMVAVETAIWNAWKDRDAEAMERLTAGDLAFVDIFGNVTSGKAETIRFWTEHDCDVRSTRVADGVRTPVSATVGILTFKGILEGTCGGLEFPLIHGTSVYMKENDDWKLAFTLNSLVN